MKVKISLERYEQLLDAETRTQVLVDKARTSAFISTQDMCRILGYNTLADKIEADKIEADKKERVVF